MQVSLSHATVRSLYYYTTILNGWKQCMDVEARKEDQYSVNSCRIRYCTDVTEALYLITRMRHALADTCCLEANAN